MGVVAAIGAAVAEVVATVAGGIAAGATAVGVGAATAVTIGEIGAGALIGAGVGAAGAAITGGNIGIGALTGGLTGGLGGAGAGAALGGALGTSASVGTGLIGAGVGALGAGLSGGNPWLGALSGGVGGYISGGGLGDLTGQYAGMTGNAAGAQPDVDSFYGTGTLHPTLDAEGNAQMIGSTGAPPIPPKLDQFGQPIPGSYGDGSAAANAVGAAQDQAVLNPQSALTTAASKSETISSGPGGGSAKKDSGDKSTFEKILNSPLTMGALSGLSTLLTPKAQTPTLGPNNTAGPKNSTNLGPLFDTPLNRLPGGGSRQFVDPNISNYYTYGQMPGAQFFQNNSLKSFGFAEGGQPEFNTAQFGSHVRGPGTGTSDEIPALLSNGEYVLTAKEVSALGGGDNDRGARVLDYSRKRGALSSLVREAA